MQLAASPLSVPATSSTATTTPRRSRPQTGTFHRGTRASYLLGYASRRRAQRFRIR